MAAAKATWSGLISFGLVSIPVKLYSALESAVDINFNQVHNACKKAINQKRWCAECEIEVPYEDLVKGYPISDELMVIIEPEELAAVRPDKTGTIAVTDFVDVAELDIMHLNTPYYMVPETRAARSFQVFREALIRTGKAGLGSMVMRQKSYPVLLRQHEGVIAMHTLYYADQVRPTDAMAPPVVDIPEAEIEMASRLIEALAAPFDLTAIVDTYRTDVMAMIEARAEGLPIPESPALPAATPQNDMMAALEASLAAAQAARDAA